MESHYVAWPATSRLRGREGGPFLRLLTEEFLLRQVPGLRLESGSIKYLYYTGAMIWARGRFLIRFLPFLVAMRRLHVAFEISLAMWGPISKLLYMVLAEISDPHGRTQLSNSELWLFIITWISTTAPLIAHSEFG